MMRPLFDFHDYYGLIPGGRLKTLPKFGNSSGVRHLGLPYGTAVDNLRSVWTIDAGNSRIAVFTFAP